MSQRSCHIEFVILSESGSQAARFSQVGVEKRRTCSSRAVPIDRVPHPERNRGPQPARFSQVGVESEGWDKALDLPAIEDTESIQLALTNLLQAIAANQLDPLPFSQTSSA